MKLSLLKKILFLLLLLLFFNCTEDLDKPKFSNIYDPSGDFDDNPPTAIVIVSPDSGIASETEFIFDASGSKEEEMPEARLFYQWDFDNNGIWNTSESINPQISHLFIKGGGNRLVKLLVKGAKGLTSIDSVNIYVNSKPTVVLNWQVDIENTNLIHYDASNSLDYEDGENLEFRWDFNNDGSWEYDWSTLSQVSYEFSRDDLELRFHVRDTQYLVSERIVSGNIPDDPIAYYPFELTVNDKTLSGINGIEYNCSYVNGIIGSGIYLNGENSWIKIPNDSIFRSNEKSIQFWFYKDNEFIEDTPGVWDLEGLIFKGYGIYEDSDYNFIIEDLNPPFEIRLTSNDFYVRQQNTIQPYNWYHIVGIINTNEISLYINGELVNSIPTYGIVINTNAPIIIGKASNYSYSTQYFSGIIDELRIYNRTLTKEEIEKLYSWR